MTLINILLKSEISKKLDSINDRFNAFVNKYIGDGLGAMVIILALIIVSIIVVRNFAKK